MTKAASTSTWRWVAGRERDPRRYHSNRPCELASAVSASGAGPLKPVEDQVEAILELVPVVVAGLHDVLSEELDEVGVLIDGERLEHGLSHLPDLPGCREREVHL